jgi:hypothetical protein
MALLGMGLVWLLVVWWVWRRQGKLAESAALHRDLLAGGLLFLLTLGFFWRTLSGDVYQPADGGDLVSFLFPTYRFAARTLSQGALPLWNPHLYGGAPFVSDIQAGFLYPPNLLLFLLNPQFDYQVMQWLAIGHIYWAGLGMYVLLRTLRWGAWGPVSRPAALFGALAFQFSDPLLIHQGNLNLITVLSWLPWVFAAYHGALAGRSLRWAALSGLLFAVGNYAGHAQSSLYIGLALVVYTVVWGVGSGGWGVGSGGWGVRSREWGVGSGRGAIQSFLAGLRFLFVTLVVTLLLTAPILLPALELAGYTARSEFSYQETVSYSLAPVQAIGLVTPGFFGRGPALHWGLWERVETPFAGVAALILALAAIILADGATRRQLWPWLALATVGFLTGLGIYAILHGWLTLLLPGFGQLRAPARALILWTFAVSVLSAVGFDHLRLLSTNIRAAAPHSPLPAPHSPLPTPHSPFPILSFLLKAGAFLLAVVFTPLLYLALLLTQHDPTAFLRASVAALAITLAAGCWLATWALIAARRAGWIGAGVWAALLIGVLYFDLAATGAYTDISPVDPTHGFHHPEIVSFLKSDLELFRIDTDTGIDDLWQPDAAALHGLEDIGGIANPLTLRHWSEVLAATGGRHARLYDMLNVKYVIVRDGTPLPEGKFELAFDAPGELAVYRNVQVMPRAWLVYEAIAQENMLDSLQADGFDPGQTVLLNIGASEAPGDGSETVDVLSAGPNRMTVRVQTTTPGYLVLSEVWYPGWRATVNGEAAEVLRANHALRALPVPAGEGVVELWFAPPMWRYGLFTWLVGAALVAGILVWQSPPRPEGTGLSEQQDR